MVVVLFLLQGLDVFNTKTNKYSPTWNIKCAVVKFSPGSVTAKIQLQVTLPGLIVDKKVEKVIKIENEEKRVDKREIFLVCTVNGDLTDRHSRMTIMGEITMIQKVWSDSKPSN